MLLFINHYKDPYKPIRIQWNVVLGLVAAAHLRYIRQFFPLDAVLEGLFDLLGDLFDVQVG